MNRQSALLKKYLSDIVFGANDGMITTFAIVAGYAGAKIDMVSFPGYMLIIVFGMANLFGDGVSMGMGNFLSIRTKQELSNSKKPRSLHEAVFHGVAVFIAFVTFGSIPLIPFFINLPREVTFKASVVSLLIGLIAVGYIRGQIVKREKITAIFETISVGLISALVAYVIGLIFRA